MFAINNERNKVLHFQLKTRIKSSGEESEIVLNKRLQEVVKVTSTLEPKTTTNEDLDVTTVMTSYPLVKPIDGYWKTAYFPNDKVIFGLYNHRDNALKSIEHTKTIETNYNTHFGSQTFELNIDEPFDYQSVNGMINSGTIPIIDYMLNWSSKDFAAIDYGIEKYESRIKNLADEIKLLDGPVFLKIGGSFNGSIFRDGFYKYNVDDSDLYKHTFQYIVDIFKEKDVENVKFIWAPNRKPLLNKTNQKWNDYSLYYPGDEYVDWIELQGFNLGTGDTYGKISFMHNPTNIQADDAKFETFDQIFQKEYKTMRRLYPDKPMMLLTSSSENGGSKGQFFRDMVNNLPTKYPNIRAVNLFQYNDPFTDYRFHSLYYSWMNGSLKDEIKTVLASELNFNYPVKDAASSFSDTLTTIKSHDLKSEPSDESTTFAILPPGIHDVTKYINGGWNYVRYGEDESGPLYAWINLNQ